LFIIAQGLATVRNFRDYSYIDEMMLDGIENCLKYIDNYDVTRMNPFAYFTQIMYYAFVRRIQTEKKQQYIKYKTYTHMMLSGQFDNDIVNLNPDIVDNDRTSDFIKNYEESIERKKEKQKANLDKFMEEKNE
jgi:hypothetical protein